MAEPDNTEVHTAVSVMVLVKEDAWCLYLSYYLLCGVAQARRT
jgi:hypothetical protein